MEPAQNLWNQSYPRSLKLTHNHGVLLHEGPLF
jgi:hypothetical protein